MSARLGPTIDRSARVEPLARLHGAFNLLGGAWPVVHLRSFEAITGPKTDDWLVRTTGALTAVVGATQLRLARDGASPGTLRMLSLGIAGTFAAIDAIYLARRRLGPAYLLDLAAETTWIAMWLRTRERKRRSP